MTLCWLPSEVVHTVEGSSSWFEIHDLDKAVHFGIFFVFACFGCRIWPFRRRYAWVGLMGIGLAAVTEIVQLLPAIGRDAECRRRGDGHARLRDRPRAGAVARAIAAFDRNSIVRQSTR